MRSQRHLRRLNIYNKNNGSLAVNEKDGPLLACILHSFTESALKLSSVVEKQRPRNGGQDLEMMCIGAKS